MNHHLIKNVKSAVDENDTVNESYVDRIKYKTTTGVISNIAMIDHILFTFPVAKAFASGKITICEMWFERLAGEWLQHQFQCLQQRGMSFTSFPEDRPL